MLFDGDVHAELFTHSVHVCLRYYQFIELYIGAGVEKAEVEVDREQVMNEMREGKKEQEDLLVLLADQDMKLKTCRRRLKELGEKVNMLVY